ncbi:MAG TPA: hypothetical protein VMV59_05325 [Candidatus Dormibacteraeota bacterium]|nr:hypothetical protein [Candidatus Dormibacteraeota bacterium]
MAQQLRVRVEEKLDRILRLLGVIAVKDLSQSEQIATLSEIGFAPSEIARILGTTPNTVRVTLVGIRKAAKHNGRRVKPPQRETNDE